LSRDFRDLNQKVEDLIIIAKAVGLRVNSKKKLNKKENTEGTEIGELVEELYEFHCLGRMVTKDGGAETDVFSPECGVGLVPKRGCLLTLAYYAFP
jgi:hypothetical protein